MIIFLTLNQHYIKSQSEFIELPNTQYGFNKRLFHSFLGGKTKTDKTKSDTLVPLLRACSSECRRLENNLYPRSVISQSKYISKVTLSGKYFTYLAHHRCDNFKICRPFLEFQIDRK